MKGIVAYDSVYGNTRKVAETIADQLGTEGHQTELINLRERVPKEIKADFMFIGSPTRIKRMTGKTRRFIKKIDAGRWGSGPICAFDTYGPIPKTEDEMNKASKWLYPGAAGEIQELAKKRGLTVHPSALRCAVTDIKGPLTSEAPQKAREFVHEFVETLGKS